MSEKEKMLTGELYNPAYDVHLEKERFYAQDLCFQLNHILPSQNEAKRLIIKKLFHQTGQNFTIMPGFQCDYGYNISIGENFFANFNCIMLDAAKIIFGDNVFIAPNCGFYTSGHPIDVNQRNQGLEYAYPITVGHNVWIGANVAVLPSVSIGNNSIIGAGSIVTKNIPDNVIAVGNPCKVIKCIDN